MGKQQVEENCREAGRGCSLKMILRGPRRAEPILKAAADMVVPGSLFAASSLRD